MDTRTPQDTTAPYPEAEDDLALRAVLACARRRNDARHAERALLQATEDLTLCSFVAWEKQRSEGTTAERLFVELQHTRFLLREAREHAEGESRACPKRNLPRSQSLRREQRPGVERGRQHRHRERVGPAREQRHGDCEREQRRQYREEASSQSRPAPVAALRYRSRPVRKTPPW